jgi:cytochrome b6-f complex iron-sulfur subunit
MPALALTLTAVAAGLLAAAFWWIRRTNLAIAPVGVLLASAVDTDTAPGGATPTLPGGGTQTSAPKPPKRKPKDIPSRRQFLRNAWLVAWLGVLTSFGGASIAFLWPNLRGGFGAQIDVDTVDNILASIRGDRAPYAFPSGRMYIVEYDPSLDPDGQYAAITNDSPLMALYQRCVHLGCKVPWCPSSQWFECPCHGSRYNRWGEWQFGPAPRGLDRFPLLVEGDRVIVDTSQIITGPTRTSPVLQQPPEGPHCTA